MVEDAFASAISFVDDPDIFRMSHSKCSSVRRFLRKATLPSTDKNINWLCYWGVTDVREPGRPELDAIGFLNSWTYKLEELLGASIGGTVVFTDTHGCINGLQQGPMFNYVETATSIIKRLTNWRTTTCSLQIRATEIPEAILINPETQCVDLDIDYARRRWSRFPVRTQREIVRLAGLHYRGDPIIGAFHYLMQNLVERAVMTRRFKDHLFITYSLPTVNRYLPALTKLHVYVSPNRNTKRPWFAKCI